MGDCNVGDFFKWSVLTGSIFAVLLMMVSFDSPRENNSLEASANMHLINDTEIPILMYHHFTEIESETSSTTVTVERFEEHMSALKDAGYNTITDDQLYRFLHFDEALPEKPIMITMDDGYESNYIHAYPILKELGMNATIYLVVNDQEKTPGTIPHLTWEQTKEMYKAGVMDIQSHTFDSHYYIESETDEGPALITIGKNEDKEVYLERIRKDLTQSKKIIESQLQKEVVTITYPYGATNEDVINIAKETGYKLGITVQIGTNNSESSPFKLKRLNVINQYDGGTLLNKIEGLE